MSPEDQDPTAWNRAEAEEGAALLETTLRRGRPGPYQIQAAIAACHTTASTAADTDWADIAGLYGELERFVPSAVIRLNRAFAVGMAEGPEAGLALVAGLEREGELADYHLLPATRADLLRRAGRRGEAAEAYERALELVERRRAEVPEAAARGVSIRVGAVRRWGDLLTPATGGSDERPRTTASHP
ncbi:hypothetical protein OG252_45940 [Streptomyces sp. NBC_01352]|uniref:hypothetical protein n=1 Tax=Streptomyces sp. NBC_01352 TaxID=2903834 RepID=UPI002E30D9E8|nr:hypothetical protein [Streptomyces sp. NBC_01352]